MPESKVQQKQVTIITTLGPFLEKCQGKDGVLVRDGACLRASFIWLGDFPGLEDISGQDKILGMSHSFTLIFSSLFLSSLFISYSTSCLYYPDMVHDTPQ